MPDEKIVITVDLNAQGAVAGVNNVNAALDRLERHTGQVAQNTASKYERVLGANFYNQQANQINRSVQVFSSGSNRIRGELEKTNLSFSSTTRTVTSLGRGLESLYHGNILFGLRSLGMATRSAFAEGGIGTYLQGVKSAEDNTAKLTPVVTALSGAFGTAARNIQGALNTTLLNDFGITAERALLNPTLATQKFIAMLSQIPDAEERAIAVSNVFGASTAKLLPTIEQEVALHQAQIAALEELQVAEEANTAAQLALANAQGVVTASGTSEALYFELLAGYEVQATAATEALAAAEVKLAAVQQGVAATTAEASTLTNLQLAVFGLALLAVVALIAVIVKLASAERELTPVTVAQTDAIKDRVEMLEKEQRATLAIADAHATEAERRRIATQAGLLQNEQTAQEQAVVNDLVQSLIAQERIEVELHNARFNQQKALEQGNTLALSSYDSQVKDLSKSLQEASQVTELARKAANSYSDAHHLGKDTLFAFAIEQAKKISNDAAEKQGLNGLNNLYADLLHNLGLTLDAQGRLARTTDAETDAINRQTDAIKHQNNVIEARGRLREATIDAAVERIASNPNLTPAQAAQEFERQRRASRFGVQDTEAGESMSLDRAVSEAQRIKAITDKLHEITSPKKARPEKTELQRLTEDFNKLTADVASFRSQGSAEFKLRFDVSELQQTKSSLDELVKLRGKLGTPLDAKLPDTRAGLDAAIRQAQRELTTKQELTKLDEVSLDLSERGVVADAQSAQARRQIYSDTQKDVETMQQLVAAKGRELDLSERVRDALAESAAIQARRVARTGAPHLTGAGSTRETQFYAEETADYATLYNTAQQQASEKATASLLNEQARRTQLADTESETYRRLWSEAVASRAKSENDVTEDIAQINARLAQGLISDELLIADARKKVEEARKHAIQDTFVQLQVLSDKIANLRGAGDNQDKTLAVNQFLTGVGENTAKNLEELTALQRVFADSGGMRKYLMSPDYLKQLNDSFDLDRYKQAINLFGDIEKKQYDIAHAAEGQSDRFELTWLKAIESVRNADEQATERSIEAQVKLADSSTFHSAQANAKVLEFLASQRSLSDVVGDFRINIIERTYNRIDDVLDRITKKLGAVGSIIKDLLSGFIRLALNTAFQKLFGSTSGAGGAGIFGGHSSTGGINLAQILSGTLGGSRPTFTTGGFAGGSGAGAYLGGGSNVVGANLLGGQLFGTGGSTSAGGLNQLAGGNIASLLTRLSAGSAAGNLSSVYASAGIDASNLALLHEVGHTATGAVGSSGLLGSMTPAVAALLPMLGLQGGGLLGGQSIAGQGVGMAGGLLLGGAGAVGLLGGSGAAIFGTGGALASFGGIAGFLTNPFTIGAGVALLIGAYILGKNKARREAEKARDKAMGDSLAQLDTILKSLHSPNPPDSTTAIAQAMAIRDQYMQSMSQIKDSKTRNIALKDVSRLDVKIAQIKQAAAAADEATRIDQKLIPTFASGGRVAGYAYGGGVPDMTSYGRISVGGFDGRDRYLAMLADDETVISPRDRAALGGAQRFSEVGVRGYPSGGRAPASPSYRSRSNDGGAPTKIVAVHVTDERYADDLIAQLSQEGENVLAVKVRRQEARDGALGRQILASFE
jgi:ribosomal protein L17